METPGYPGEMATLSQVINQLYTEGYQTDFNLPATANTHIENIINNPEHFVIDTYYRFEGESDPDDEAIVYAISSLNGEIKGVFVNGYGTSSEPVADVIINKLKNRSATS